MANTSNNVRQATITATYKRCDPRAEIFEDMSKVFSAVANEDAIKIFYAAKDGIKSSMQAIKELNLTQKRYYTHLKRLIECGLVEKADGVYKHTTLGKIYYKLAELFENTLFYRSRLELVDRVCRIKDVPAEEMEEIMRTILKDLDLALTEGIVGVLGPVKAVDSWDRAVINLAKYIEKSKESVYLASQHVDAKIIETLFSAVQRGVKVYYLLNEDEEVSGAFKLIIRLVFSHPRTLKFLLQTLNSPNLEIRWTDVPYSLAIIDERIVMVEVVKPLSKEFSIVFFLQNQRMARQFIESFNILWRRSTEAKFISH